MAIVSKTYGSGGANIKADIITLASGTAEFNTGMQRCIVVCSPVDASAIPAETFGVVETENSDGTVSGPSVTIESSNGSSAEKVAVLAIGY